MVALDLAVLHVRDHPDGLHRGAAAQSHELRVGRQAFLEHELPEGPVGRELVVEGGRGELSAVLVEELAADPTQHPDPEAEVAKGRLHDAVLWKIVGQKGHPRLPAHERAPGWRVARLLPEDGVQRGHREAEAAAVGVEERLVLGQTLPLGCVHAFLERSQPGHADARRLGLFRQGGVEQAFVEDLAETEAAPAHQADGPPEQEGQTRAVPACGRTVVPEQLPCAAPAHQADAPPEQSGERERGPPDGSDVPPRIPAPRALTFASGGCRAGLLRRRWCIGDCWMATGGGLAGLRRGSSR